MLPLEGVRILAVEQYGAGPMGTQYLVDMGAEVIKIENPGDGGDVSRSVGPYFLNEEKRSDSSIFYQGLNHNKKSITLDLSSTEGQKILHQLIKNVDALVCNLRGDVPGKLGLTYAHLKDINPKLVCGHLTAYGREGERADWPGYDYMMQAEAGYFSLTGDPGSPPARFGLSIVDFMTGLALAYATVAALISARDTGIGRDIDVSLFDVALYNLNYIGHWQLNAGHNQQRLPRSAHAALTPCQLYTTQDGWIYIMCNKEKFWQVLCNKIDRPDLAAAARYKTFKERLERRDELTDILDAVFARKTTQAWLDHFDGHVPAAPIYDVQDAMNNPFVKKMGRIQTMEYGDGNRLQLIRSPIKCGKEELALRPSPTLGEQTRELMQELGYSSEEIKTFEAAGVI